MTCQMPEVNPLPLNPNPILPLPNPSLHIPVTPSNQDNQERTAVCSNPGSVFYY